MTAIQATVQRDGKWWVVDFTIDGHEYATQVRQLDQAEAMVKDAAALMTDRSEDTFTVTVDVNAPDYLEVVEDYRAAATAANKAAEAAQGASRAAVTRLRAAGLPVRDVATLMGVSPQRVSQLAAS
ncbi:hypothetical protein [Actinomyces trachealis]|uniref:hypothetical protein n=1 Tax=Actinomyces trachealis TaxID=2763540 RepID=UPI001892CE60|nr:hypothetical protein [Actinomyces trachealis]